MIMVIVPIGIPVKKLTIVEIPVTPPGAKWFGAENTCVLSANKNEPKIVQIISIVHRTAGF